MTFAEWNQGMLLSVVLVVVGGMLLVGASSLVERLIAVGTLSQAIVLAFVTNGAFHRRSDLPLAAISLVGLFVLWSLLVANAKSQDEVMHEITGVADNPSPSDATSLCGFSQSDECPHQLEE